MELKDFKNHIENFEEGHLFNYGISEPFCWRGRYIEVAFEMLEETMIREEILNRIEMAYTEEFIGYKGGTYRFHDYTDVHFEYDSSSYSDGGYCRNWLEKIENKEQYDTPEMKLVKLAFSK
jgi:hypothetical protein